MPALDDTDLRILELLAEDARLPYSDISEAVGLSPPAVSDRVERLEEVGVIRRFTVDVDRGQLRAGVPVLVTVSPVRGEREAARDALAGAEAVEHVFVTAEGDVVCQARVPGTEVGAWLEDLVGGDTIREREVELLDEVTWTPVVGGTDFALTCDECGNTVTDEGTSVTLDGDRHHFCCPTCESRFVERYERYAEGTED